MNGMVSNKQVILKECVSGFPKETDVYCHKLHRTEGAKRSKWGSVEELVL